MFFLITNITIGKYYPNLFTQLVLGCICYIISFLFLKDFISCETYDKYKYYALCLIIIDSSYLFYKSKTKEKIINNNNRNVPTVKSEPETNTASDKSFDLYSTTSSEVNDFKINHDLSTSSDNLDMFSTSDEKDDKKNKSINVFKEDLVDSASKTSENSATSLDLQ